MGGVQWVYRKHAVGGPGHARAVNDWRRSEGKPPLEIDDSELEERLTAYGGA